MTGAMLRAENRWRLIFRLGEWEVFHRGGPTAYGWSDIVVRRLDPRARRRSWHLSWSHNEHRLSERPNLDDLRQHHSDLVRDLLRRLKVWQP